MGEGDQKLRGTEKVESGKREGRCKIFYQKFKCKIFYTNLPWLIYLTK